MTTAAGCTAFPTAPAARPRPVRRLLTVAATACHASGTANLAQQLRQLKQFKVRVGQRLYAGQGVPHRLCCWAAATPGLASCAPPTAPPAHSFLPAI